jgi:putative acetyltransferase
MTMISESMRLTELAAEFPGYDFSTQRTWEGVSLIAVRQDGSARPGLYAVITADLEEMRRALLEGEGLEGEGLAEVSSVRIVVDDLTGPQIAGFLDEHVREMLSVSPPESKHALDLEALRGPGITFWSVLDGGAVVGCGALKRLDASHAEVKSMRTAPARKRSGIASMVLEHIITEARRMGFTRLSLETGSAEFFGPARKLYEKFGFEYCEPFADYRPDPLSVFLTRRL